MFWNLIYLVGGLVLLYKVFFPKRKSRRYGKAAPLSFDETVWRVLLCICGLVLIAMGVVGFLVAFSSTQTVPP